ncbi:hypothetical protein ITX31_07495 [Arthrobacter gandavensis]|uniref:AAA family ATPase n=1 Tax=Arthrobacter gandavensis TaxID=169960 RepID=UPI00188E3029|nr:AAA family ATPase [Arthrobacter gandavensis]MBF4993955.1 hypothetical protein [Arthrobacter gandavensis]
MTENNPAANEQALPTRRARRAAQNTDMPGTASGAGQRAAQGSGVQDSASAGQAAGEGAETLPSRRRARAELRSRGSDQPSGLTGAGDGRSPAAAAGVLLGDPSSATPDDDGQPDSTHTADETAALPEAAPESEPETAAEPEFDAEPETETAAEPEADAEPAAEPEFDAEPETDPASDTSTQPEPPVEAVPMAANAAPEAPRAPEFPPVREAAPESTPDPVQEPGLSTDGQPLAVALPELPAAPPAGAQQEMEMKVRDPAEDPAGPPAGLPPEPAQMPVDLRERTRAAVRGEPNDVRRATFLDTQTAKIPAARGFRGFLAFLGIRIAPSARELEERRDTRIVSQHWPGPRTISVVNGKGGANKTPTTVMLAAIFARNGGGPVLAWDNNETRGTLGWRTEQAQHDATVMDLLPETGLLQSPAAQSAMLAKFVHHQTDDKYDVLRSNPNVLASEQKVTKADFDALHSVASKYFRLNVVDSGNDESAERWLRMIDHTDQLVIATTTVEEHAEAGALLLEALQERGGKYAELARGAVVIVSQADRNGTEAQARRVAEAFKVLARAAVTIPYDPELVKGQIRYASLRPATQRAWLRAAAAVAGGL